VLAVRTAEISNTITAVSHEVSGRLVRLREVTDEMFGLFDQVSQEGGEREQRMEVAKGPVEAELHRLRDQTLEVFHTITQAVDQVRTAANGLDRTLGEIPGAHSGLLKAVEDLEVFASKYCTGDDELSEDAGRLLAAHADKYTMASERQVHASITGGRPSAGTQTGTGDAGLELFDEPNAGTSVAVRRSEPAATATSPGSRAGAPKNDPSLGSNVDLF
jgi:hypothetical protein